MCAHCRGAMIGFYNTNLFIYFTATLQLWSIIFKMNTERINLKWHDMVVRGYECVEIFGLDNDDKKKIGQLKKKPFTADRLIIPMDKGVYRVQAQQNYPLEFVGRWLNVGDKIKAKVTIRLLPCNEDAILYGSFLVVLLNKASTDGYKQLQRT